MSGEQPFRVEDDSSATWAMKKLRDLILKIRENERIADEQFKAVAEWLQEVNATLNRDAAFFEDQLTDYLRRERDNRKSIKLPWGTIKSRATSRVEVGEEFIAWAQQNNRDDLLTFAPPKPNLAKIKTEQNLEFVEVVESVSYSVEVKE
jgi:hypothetical protein